MIFLLLQSNIHLKKTPFNLTFVAILLNLFDFSRFYVIIIIALMELATPEQNACRRKDFN